MQNPYEDTDDQQTVPYVIQDPTTVRAAHEQAPKVEEKSEGIAMAPVIGSALAAVTSLLLPSRIGVGGAVVTAAVGAAVTTLTTQIYTRLAKASAEKLRNVASGTGHAQLTGVMDSSQLDQGYAATGYAGYDQTQAYQATGYEAAPGQARVAPAGLRQAAAKRHSSQVRKRGIIITVIVALVTVLAAAAVVGLATAGEGIGPKTQPIIATSTGDTSKDQEASSQAKGTASTDASQTDDATSTSTGTVSGTATDPNSSSAGTSDNGASTSGQSSAGTSGTSSSTSGSGGTSSGTGTTDPGTTNGGGNGGTSDTPSNSSGTSDSDNTADPATPASTGDASASN